MSLITNSGSLSARASEDEEEEALRKFSSRRSLVGTCASRYRCRWLHLLAPTFLHFFALASDYRKNYTRERKQLQLTHFTQKNAPESVSIKRKISRVTDQVEWKVFFEKNSSFFFSIRVHSRQRLIIPSPGLDWVASDSATLFTLNFPLARFLYAIN